MTEATHSTEVGSGARAGVPALAYHGEAIHLRGETMSLTDMWRAANSPEGKRPDDWKKDSANRAFLDHIATMANTPVEGIWKGTRGAGGSTWAHWQIGLAYAKYLSADFHAWCNTVVRERMEGRDLPAAIDMKAVGGMVKGILAKQLGELIPMMVREQVAEQQNSVVRGLSAGQVLALAGISARKGLRGMAPWVSHRLRRFHAQRGVVVRLASLGSSNAYVFDPLVTREWLEAGGRAEIEQKAAERRGQGALRLVPSPQS